MSAAEVDDSLPPPKPMLSIGLIITITLLCIAGFGALVYTGVYFLNKWSQKRRLAKEGAIARDLEMQRQRNPKRPRVVQPYYSPGPQRLNSQGGRKPNRGASLKKAGSYEKRRPPMAKRPPARPYAAEETGLKNGGWEGFS